MKQQKILHLKHFLNLHKNKTKQLKYEKFEMRRYLCENENTKITKFIFNI